MLTFFFFSRKLRLCKVIGTIWPRAKPRVHFSAQLQNKARLLFFLATCVSIFVFCSFLLYFSFFSIRLIKSERPDFPYLAESPSQLCYRVLRLVSWRGSACDLDVDNGPNGYTLSNCRCNYRDKRYNNLSSLGIPCRVRKFVLAVITKQFKLFSMFLDDALTGTKVS